MAEVRYQLSVCRQCGLVLPERPPPLRLKLLPPAVPCPRCKATIETTWDHRLLWAERTCANVLVLATLALTAYFYFAHPGTNRWVGALVICTIASFVVGRWVALGMMPIFEAFGRK